MPQFPYNRTSEYGRALLSMGRGIGKPGRIGDPVVRFRPLRSDAPDVANRPIRRARLGGQPAARRTVADRLVAMQDHVRRDADTRARYASSGPFLSQSEYAMRQAGARS